MITDVIRLLAAIALFVALANLPYDYYTLLRVVVTATALFTLAEKKRAALSKVSMVAFALLFNPLFPVHLRKETWQICNVLAAICFLTQTQLVQSKLASVKANSVDEKST
jgi:hypothetical protein